MEKQPSTGRQTAGRKPSAGVRPVSRTVQKPVQHTAVSTAVRKPSVQPVRSRAAVKQPVRSVRRRAVREPRFITVRKRRHERVPFPFGIVLVLGVITVLFLFMMMNYAEIDKYNGEITSLKKEVASLQAEQKKLDVRLENKNDRVAFEQYAADQLGMVKGDSLNRYIVDIGNTDKTEIVQYDDGKESGFGYLLSGLSEVFRDFLP